MNKVVLTAILAAIALSASIAVSTAGWTNDSEVRIWGTSIASGGASGSIAATRASDDNLQYIGCNVAVYKFADRAPTRYAFCRATSTGGTSDYLYCSTSDPQLLSVIHSINGGSHLEFRSNSGSCSFIRVDNSSKHGQKE